MSRRTELARDLVAPALTAAILAILLWLAALLPTFCNGMQVCSPDLRPRIALVAGLALVTALTVTVAIRARNASGFRSAAEEWSYIALLIVGVAGLVVTIASGGFGLFAPFLIGLARS